MKRTLTLALLASLLAGCSLIPKSVEFGQRKIKAFPEASAKLQEVQRQAAEMAARKAKETVEAAKAEDCTAMVTEPAKEAAELTQVVSTSLGPPSNRWEKDSLALVEKLEHQIAALNDKIDKFAKRNDKDEGKKIEGTGFLQIPYFVYLGGIFALLWIVYIVLKTVGNVAAVGNPGVAVGMKVASLGGRALSGAFSELVKGGESFKDKVKSKFEPAVSAQVLELFNQSHRMEQSPTTQDVVKKLTA